MSGNPITIRHLGPEDADILDRVRPGTIGDDLDPSRVWAFLSVRVNTMVVALDRGEVVGIASGTVLMGLDGPPEFLVKVIGVQDGASPSEVANRLVQRLTDLARDRGCEVIWSLSSDAAAQQMYRATHGVETKGIVRHEWDGAI